MGLLQVVRVLLGQAGPPPTVPWQKDQPREPVPLDEAFERFRRREAEAEHGDA